MAESLLIVLCLRVCSWQAADSGKQRSRQVSRTGTLLVGNGAEPEDLDPHITTGIPEFKIQTALFEPLVSADPETLEPVPAAAEFAGTCLEDGTDLYVSTCGMMPGGRMAIRSRRQIGSIRCVGL